MPRERVLVAGDTHGNMRQIMHLLAVAKRQSCDAIFVLGDFGYWEHMWTGQKFLNGVEKLAGRQGISIYFLDGNHDKTSLLLEKYQNYPDPEGFLQVRSNVLYAPRGHRWLWGGRRFVAFGGAYSVDKAWRLASEREGRRPAGTLWFPEEEMTDDDMAKHLADDSSSVDIMLAHDKPRASNPSWNRKDLMECHPNQDRLQMAVMALTPSLFLHGHLHWRYTDHIRTGPDTWCEVQGFTPDPDAAEAGYQRFDSRAVLHVAEKRIELVP